MYSFYFGDLLFIVFKKNTKDSFVFLVYYFLEANIDLRQYKEFLLKSLIYYVNFRANELLVKF